MSPGQVVRSTGIRRHRNQRDLPEDVAQNERRLLDRLVENRTEVPETGPKPRQGWRLEQTLASEPEFVKLGLEHGNPMLGLLERLLNSRSSLASGNVFDQIVQPTLLATKLIRLQPARLGQMRGELGELPDDPLEHVVDRLSLLEALTNCVENDLLG